MKNILILFSFISLSTSLGSAASQEAALQTGAYPEIQKKVIYGKNFLGLELLGRGIGYSLNYDRALDSKFSMGGGFSYYQLQVRGFYMDLALIPVYANYYFGSGRTHRGFLAGGATILYVNAEYDTGFYGTGAFSDDFVGRYYGKTEGLSLFPNAGLGYEYRANSGFTARFTAYAQYIETVLPWVGITLGAHF